MQYRGKQKPIVHASITRVVYNASIVISIVVSLSCFVAYQEYTYTHAQTHTCTDTHMHRHTHAQTHTCTDTHMHRHTHTYIQSALPVMANLLTVKAVAVPSEHHLFVQSFYSS